MNVDVQLRHLSFCLDWSVGLEQSCISFIFTGSPQVINVVPHGSLYVSYLKFGMIV